jgi:hypothetical protein
MALYKDVSDGSSLDDARLRWRRSIVVCRILEGDPTPKLELHDWFPQSAHGRALYSYVAYLPLGRRRYQRNPSWRDSRFPPHRRATCVWQGSQGRRRPGITQVPGFIAFTDGQTCTSAGSAPAAPPTRMGPALRPASIAPRMYSNSGRRRLKVAEGSNSDARF